MSRRDALGLLGVSGISLAGGIGVFKPDLLVGHPQGRGDPIAVGRTVTDDSIEYRPVSDTVRYPTLRNQSGPVAHETEPFKKWASRKCAVVGSDAVLPAIQNRLDTEIRGVGKATSNEFIGMVITVTIGTVRDRDGDVISEPNVSTESVLDVTPQSVRTTIRLENREYTRSVPVFVEETNRVSL